MQGQGNFFGEIYTLVSYKSRELSIFIIQPCKYSKRLMKKQREVKPA